MVPEKKTINIQLRLLINLVLFLCIIGLAAFLMTRKDPPETETETAVILTKTHPDSVKVIHVERRDMEDIIFQKRKGYWHMQSPFNLPVNFARIRFMLSLLQAHSYTQISAADNDLTAFMLTLPEISIIFNDVKISFGDLHPIDKQTRYVLLNDQVHLINDNLFYQLQASATFFLDPKLVPENATIKSIRSSALTIKGDKQPSDPERNITYAWQQAEAVIVRKYEEAVAIDSVQLTLDTEEIITFTIIADRPNLILARPDQQIQYHIANDIADSLFPAHPNNRNIQE